jgi:hypothetical protein
LRTTDQVVLDHSCGNGLRQVDCRPSFRFEDHAIFHNRAAFLAYQRLAKRMRLIFGMIVGAALTVGGAYVADAMARTESKPIVNWSVVAENIDTVTALARAGWKRIAS